MKKSILTLFLAGMIALSGCSSLLERDYLLLQPYEPVSSSAPGSTSLRAESYQDVVDAVRLLVAQGADQGLISLYNYSSAQDVEDTLTRACLEVVQNDPLGAYAVDYIKHDYSLIVSYYEVNLTLAYRRTSEQVSSIVSVTGSSALQQELTRALTSFSPEVTLRVSHFTEDAQYICQLVEQIYYDTPAAAFGMPAVTVSIYPDSGLQRIVEIGFSYSEAPEILLLRSQELRELATDLVTTPSSYENLFAALLDNFAFIEGSFSHTAYDALVYKASDSEGLALAYQLLCKQAGLPCTIVRGEKDGTAFYWNLIGDENTAYRHAVLSAEVFSASDEEMTAAGYTWDQTVYPAAPSLAEPPVQSPAEEN